MANPLARVVMRSIVSKKGEAKGKRQRGTSQKVNLSSNEENLLSSIMNGSKKAMTLESLGAKKGNVPASSSYSTTSQSSAQTTSKGMGSLKTIDSLLVGKTGAQKPSSPAKTNYGSSQTGYGRQASQAKSGGIKAVSIDSLVSGSGEAKTLESKPNNRLDRRSTSTKQGGMMSLGQLAGNKPESENSKESSMANKTSAKGSVIGNLNTYVPKVTLDSIGKKGSLFKL